jgi:hypothetical protein
MYCFDLQNVCANAAEQPMTRVSERVKLAMPISTKRKLAEIVLAVPGRRTFNVDATRLSARYAKKRGGFADDQRYPPIESISSPVTAMHAIKTLALIVKPRKDSKLSFPR